MHNEIQNFLEKLHRKIDTLQTGTGFISNDGIDNEKRSLAYQLETFIKKVQDEQHWLLKNNP